MGIAHFLAPEWLAQCILCPYRWWKASAKTGWLLSHFLLGIVPSLCLCPKICLWIVWESVSWPRSKCATDNFAVRLGPWFVSRDINKGSYLMPCNSYVAVLNFWHHLLLWWKLTSAASASLFLSFSLPACLGCVTTGGQVSRGNKHVFFLLAHF